MPRTEVFEGEGGGGTEPQDSIALVDDLDFLHILGCHIGVAPSPYSPLVRMVILIMIVRSLIFRAVACSGRAFLYHAVRHGLQIVCPSNPGEEVDEGGGEVGAIVSQFAGFVIPRKHMVVIVPAFAEGPDADAETVGGANGAATKIRTRFSYLLPFTQVYNSKLTIKADI